MLLSLCLFEGPRKNTQSEGFIFNLVHKLPSTPNPHRSSRFLRTMNTFDVRKSEFRVKPAEMNLFSNFGISNSTFDSSSTVLKEFMDRVKQKDNISFQSLRSIKYGHEIADPSLFDLLIYEIINRHIFHKNWAFFNGGWMSMVIYLKELSILLHGQTE